MKKLIFLLGVFCITIFLANNVLAVPYSAIFDADPYDGGTITYPSANIPGPYPAGDCGVLNGTSADSTQAWYCPESIGGWDIEAVQSFSMTDKFTATSPVLVDFQSFTTPTGPIGITDAQALWPAGIPYGPTLQNGDVFTEQITTAVPGGLTPSFGTGTAYTNALNHGQLFFEINLSGTIQNHSPGADGKSGAASDIGLFYLQDDTFKSIFDAGTTATLYRDCDAQFMNPFGINSITGYVPSYDGGVCDDTVATFTLTNSLPFEVNAGLLTLLGQAASTQLEFSFNTYNPNYFLGPPEFYDLVLNNWAMTVQSGLVNLEAVDHANGDIVLGWTDSGFDARFDAVPEPTSMLLLGTGLVGLAGFRRRRKIANKK